MSKATKCLNCIRFAMYGCIQAAKISAYKALVRPHLEYACAVWPPYMTPDIGLLALVQHRAARWIKSFWDSSADKMIQIYCLCQLNWGGLHSKCVKSSYLFGLSTPSFIREQPLIFPNIFILTG